MTIVPVFGVIWGAVVVYFIFRYFADLRDANRITQRVNEALGIQSGHWRDRWVTLSIDLGTRNRPRCAVAVIEVKTPVRLRVRPKASMRWFIGGPPKVNSPDAALQLWCDEPSLVDRMFLDHGIAEMLMSTIASDRGGMLDMTGLTLEVKRRTSRSDDNEAALNAVWSLATMMIERLGL